MESETAMGYKYGLKLWSINLNYIRDALLFFNEGLYDYIELYTVPDTFDTYLPKWKELQIPFVIHAPHIKHGMNLSLQENEKVNRQCAEESLRFADALQAEIVIMHPGLNGECSEVIRQVNSINDSRIVIENMPYYGIKDYGLCVGSTPSEMEEIVSRTNAGFCLDIGHAVYAANAKGFPVFETLSSFVDLKPAIYHLSGGDTGSTVDLHYHFYQGNFPLKKIMQLVPKGAKVSIETGKDSEENLDDFKEDLKILGQSLQKP